MAIREESIHQSIHLERTNQMRGIPHMVATINCQSISNPCRRGNAKTVVSGQLTITSVA